VARFKTILTDVGAVLLTQALVREEKVNIDSVEMGDGVFEGDKARVRGITSPITVNTKMSDREFVDGGGEQPSLLKITVQTFNDGLTSPAAIREIGLFAEGTLFAYAWIDGADTDNILPPPLDISVADTIHVHELALFVTNQESANIEVSFTFGGFVTHRHLDEQMKTTMYNHNTDPDAHGGLTNIIISDVEPTEPSQFWLKPHGGAISNNTGSGITLNISGAHVGDSPPTDTSNIWFESIEA